MNVLEKTKQNPNNSSKSSFQLENNKNQSKSFHTRLDAKYSMPLAT